MHRTCNQDCNQNYDYFSNVIEYDYDYLAFLTKVFEYEYDYSENVNDSWYTSVIVSPCVDFALDRTKNHYG